MTRYNKYAARFGDRYQPPVDWRRFRDGLQKAQPAIRWMTEAFRQVADNMRRAREMEQTARQVQAVINGPGGDWTELDLLTSQTYTGDPIADGTAVPYDGGTADAATVMLFAGWGHQPDILGPTRSPAEFVQYADDVLEAVGYDPMYPEPHQHTDEPWPYRGF